MDFRGIPHFEGSCEGIYNSKLRQPLLHLQLHRSCVCQNSPLPILLLVLLFYSRFVCICRFSAYSSNECASAFTGSRRSRFHWICFQCVSCNSVIISHFADGTRNFAFWIIKALLSACWTQIIGDLPVTSIVNTLKLFVTRFLKIFYLRICVCIYIYLHTLICIIFILLRLMWIIDYLWRQEIWKLLDLSNAHVLVTSMFTSFFKEVFANKKFFFWMIVIYLHCCVASTRFNIMILENPERIKSNWCFLQAMTREFAIYKFPLPCPEMVRT